MGLPSREHPIFNDKTGGETPPLRTHINFGRELVFSAELCYNVVTRRAGACSRRNERYESKKAAGVG